MQRRIIIYVIFNTSIDMNEGSRCTLLYVMELLPNICAHTSYILHIHIYIKEILIQVDDW